MNRTKKVLIIAANGFANLFNPSTCDKRIMHTIGEAFTPLELEGNRFWDLSSLKAYLLNKRGLAVQNSKRPYDDPTQSTNLNGIILFTHLLRAGFEPLLVNDFGADIEVVNEALEGDLLAIGISTTFLPFKEHLAPVVSYLRQRRPDVPIVAGGPMVALSYALYTEPDPVYDVESLKRLYLFFDNDDHVDYYVVDRRGEKTFLKLLHALYAKNPPGDVKNIACRTGQGSLFFTPVEAEITDVSDEIIDWDRIPDHLLKHNVSLRASTGCPFKCEFCNFHFYAPQPMHKPLELIAAELKQLARRRQVKHFAFVDDNFLISPAKVESFCKTLSAMGTPATWSSFIRSDSITKDNIEAIADSGAFLLNLGVESGDPGVLSNMNKKSRTGHVIEVINHLGRLGVPTVSSIVVGFPGETHETVGNTIEFLNDYHTYGDCLHWYSPFVFMMLPKVRVEREREKYGLEGFMLKWKHNTMDAYGAAHELKRIMLETEGAVFPRSLEYPYAPAILGINPADSAKVIRLIDKHIKNQVLAGDTGDPEFVRKNAEIAGLIEGTICR
ncbi:MAG: radical SAM protein [Nitrospirae bacterium]|nr:radical SAM protein [Nitrospirota bacterium]